MTKLLSLPGDAINSYVRCIASSSHCGARRKGDGPSMGIGSEVLETIFIQCIIWSIGAGLLEEGRVKFDAYVKKLAALIQNNGEGACAKQGEIPINLPTLYEYMFYQ